MKEGGWALSTAWREVFGRLKPMEWVFLLVSALLIGRVWDLRVFALTQPLIRSLVLAVVYYLIAERAPRPFDTLAWSLLVSLVAIVIGPLIL